MTKTVITHEEGGAELSKPYEEYARAVAHTASVLKQRGMGSEEFSQADAEAGRLYRRIREIQGDSGKPWDA